MFDFGIDAAIQFQQIAYYGHLWLVEFRDWTQIIVIEDPKDSPDENHIVNLCE